MSFSCTRREFLKRVSVLSLSLTTLSFKNPHTAEAQEEIEYLYRDWEDLYREEWAWDHVVKGSHNVMCAYQGGCNFNIFVRDGIVLREEQVADYPQTNPYVPDFNPKGCQKGCSFSHRMYDQARIRYPLKRV